MKNKILKRLKEKAFTLAETLIVIGVIGVVAALTLPNLNSSTGDKERMTKVKKIYSNLTDAFDRAEAVYGPFDEWFKDDTTAEAKTIRFVDRISEFMKVGKNCGWKGNSTCWTDSVTKKIEGDNWSNLNRGDYVTFTLADGTAFAVIHQGVNVAMYTDIDGVNKGKNTIGKDIFVYTVISWNNNFQMTPCGIDHVGEDDWLKVRLFKDGINASIWIMENDNMDYLKADTSGKCPNGTQLTWTQTSCN